MLVNVLSGRRFAGPLGVENFQRFVFQGQRNDEVHRQALDEVSVRVLHRAERLASRGQTVDRQRLLDFVVRTARERAAGPTPEVSPEFPGLHIHDDLQQFIADFIQRAHIVIDLGLERNTGRDSLLFGPEFLAARFEHHDREIFVFKQVLGISFDRNVHGRNRVEIGNHTLFVELFPDGVKHFVLVPHLFVKHRTENVQVAEILGRNARRLKHFPELADDGKRPPIIRPGPRRLENFTHDGKDRSVPFPIRSVHAAFREFPAFAGREPFGRDPQVQKRRTLKHLGSGGNFIPLRPGDSGGTARRVQTREIPRRPESGSAFSARGRFPSRSGLHLLLGLFIFRSFPFGSRQNASDRFFLFIIRPGLGFHLFRTRSGIGFHFFLVSAFFGGQTFTASGVEHAFQGLTVRIVNRGQVKTFRRRPFFKTHISFLSQSPRGQKSFRFRVSTCRNDGNFTNSQIFQQSEWSRE